MTDKKILAEAQRNFLRATLSSRRRFGDTPEGFFHSSATAAFKTRRHRVFDTADEAAKDAFKAAARAAVDLVIETAGYGRQSADGTSHSRAIERLADGLSREGAGILAGGRFRIGVAQKLLNMHLKYLWADGKITPPPHCPFDSVIIYSGAENLWPQMADKNAECRWTVSDDIGHYQAWVDAAQRAADAGGFASIAEWELMAYNQSEYIRR